MYILKFLKYNLIYLEISSQTIKLAKKKLETYQYTCKTLTAFTWSYHYHIIEDCRRISCVGKFDILIDVTVKMSSDCL